jgi:hypothetical protein
MCSSLRRDQTVSTQPLVIVTADDEHIGLETCRELEINKYIERN